MNAYAQGGGHEDLASRLKIDTAVDQTQSGCANNRIIRTARVQLQSREIGKHVYHPDGAHALLRNKIMKSKSQDEWHDNIEWLYGGTGLDH